MLFHGPQIITIPERGSQHHAVRGLDLEKHNTAL